MPIDNQDFFHQFIREEYNKVKSRIEKEITSNTGRIEEFYSKTKLFRSFLQSSYQIIRMEAVKTLMQSFAKQLKDAPDRVFNDFIALEWREKLQSNMQEFSENHLIIGKHHLFDLFDETNRQPVLAHKLFRLLFRCAYFFLELFKNISIFDHLSLSLAKPLWRFYQRKINSLLDRECDEWKCFLLETEKAYGLEFKNRFGEYCNE